MSPEDKVYLYARAFRKWDSDPESLTPRDAAIIKMAFSQNPDLIQPLNKPLLKGLGNNQPLHFRNGILDVLCYHDNLKLKKDGYFIYLHMKQPNCIMIPNYNAANDELAYYNPKCLNI